MIYLLIGMGLLFVTIGYLVTENNAKYLLSGYNTLPEEEQKKVDLKSYIPYFRRFHRFLGLSLIIVGIILNYGFGEVAGGVFLTVYPILCYIFFIFSSSKYSKGLNTKWNKVGVFILSAVLLFLLGIFTTSLREDELIVTPGTISIEGSYGEELRSSEIKSIELIEELPVIKMRTNGFALGTVRKGYFKTADGEIIKLILNSNKKPYLLITKNTGEKVYFNVKDGSTSDLMSEIKEKQVTGG